MRRRIALVMAPVLILLGLGAGLPLGVMIAERSTQLAFADRQGDASRFASMVDAAIDTGRATRLRAELSDYEQLYDSPVWVIGLDEVLLHGSSQTIPDDPDFAAMLQLAFAGIRPTTIPAVWPWRESPIHVMEPVGRDSQVTAVVVIEAPTHRLRLETASRWALGAVLISIPIAALVAGLWPLTLWMLRPVRHLEEVAVAVRSGDLGARADAERGPPELRELASSINAMVGTVQATLRRQRAFVEDAAHQLRNPLVSLRLAVENLNPWMRDEEAREAHADASEEAERIGEMFEEMLAATALAADRGMQDDERTLPQVLAAGVARWQAVLAEAGMTLVVDESIPGVTPRSPAGGLDGVLDELISNAARLSEGTTASITATVDQEAVRIEVADDGVGLDLPDREAALGRFWRASRHQNTRGTGLGLAILGDLLGDVGGALALEQAEPRGLRVVISLPLSGDD